MTKTVTLRRRSPRGDRTRSATVRRRHGWLMRSCEVPAGSVTVSAVPSALAFCAWPSRTTVVALPKLPRSRRTSSASASTVASIVPYSGSRMRRMSSAAVLRFSVRIANASEMGSSAPGRQRTVWRL